MKNVLLLAILAGSVVTLSACSTQDVDLDGEAEVVVESEAMVDDAVDSAEGAADEVADAVEDAIDAADDAMDNDVNPSIVDIVVSSTESNPAEFTVLLAAIQNADPVILETLSGDGPFTVFAPTDEAFGALLEDLNMTAEELLASTEVLNTTLLYHVVSGSFVAEDVVALNGQNVPTLLENNEIMVSVTDAGVVLNNNVNVVTTDIAASNGVVHVIDAVLLP